MHSTREYNFDGLVGPSHNYAGLSFGNVASFSNVKSASNPKQAALQGLAKMRALAARGFAQALLPPQDRPNFRLLRAIGFTGTDGEVLARAYKESPVILACAYSASPMWTANAATVSPSADTQDGRVHFTAANLNNKLHRAFEHAQSARSLRAIFGDEKHFAVHDALPSTPAFGDEGAANHTRLGARHRWSCSCMVGWSSIHPRRRRSAIRRARPWKRRKPWRACMASMQNAPCTCSRIRT